MVLDKAGPVLWPVIHDYSLTVAIFTGATTKGLMLRISHQYAVFGAKSTLGAEHKT